MPTFWIFKEVHCFINWLVRCLEVGDMVFIVSSSDKHPNPALQDDNFDKSFFQASYTLSPFPDIALKTSVHSYMAN